MSIHVHRCTECGTRFNIEVDWGDDHWSGSNIVWQERLDCDPDCCPNCGEVVDLGNIFGTE